MNLPDFDDIDAKPTHTRTTLERFIYDNDPVPENLSSQFRKNLKAVLQEHEADHRKQVAEMLGFDQSDLPWPVLRSHIKTLLASEEEAWKEKK